MAIPVIVGVGRITQREANMELACDPIQLSVRATEAALSDAGVDRGVVDAVIFMDISGEWRGPLKRKKAYKNPPLSIVKQCGLVNVQYDKCFLSEEGGNMPQWCVNEVAEKIAKGELDCVLITGAEAIDTFMKAQKQGFKFSSNVQTNTADKIMKWGDDPVPGQKATHVGSKEKFITMQDLLHGTIQMPSAYALVEQAVRRADGASLSDRSKSNAQIFHGYTKVAASNKNAKHSWFPRERSVKEIYSVHDKNRMVSHPYPKLMCSILDVNQAASILIMSDKKAKSLSISQDKWVFLHGCADSNDLSPRVIQRPQLERCYGMNIAGEEAIRSANIPMSKIDFFEIYSCFPVAVRLACREMGIDQVVDIEKDSYRLTQTGGLPYHGGSGNNFVSHGIVAMVEKLRNNPGSFGLVTANGGVVSKSAVGIYSTTPYQATHPEHPNQWIRPNCDNRLRQLKKDIPLRNVPLNPGNCSGLVRHYTIQCGKKSKPTLVIILGDITSGPHTGSRFIAISSEVSALEKFWNNPDSCFDLPVYLRTVDTDGKGNKFKTSFSLVDSPSSKL